jgi:hypothetical protein
MLGTVCIKQVEYLLCYAAAGTLVQFCALQRGTSGSVHKLGAVLDISTTTGKLRALSSIIVAIGIIRHQHEQLSGHHVAVGAVEKRERSVITYMDNFVQKRVSLEDLPQMRTRLPLLQKLYKAVESNRNVVHAARGPKLKKGEYSVDLTPLGDKMSSAPVDTQMLRSAIRHVIQTLNNTFMNGLCCDCAC